MSEQYLRKQYMGTTADIKNLEIQFAEMAEKGWMIDKISLFTHRYRAIEPCKKRFFVDLLPQITVFDYPENEDAQDYRAICEASGWHFVTASKQIHVFSAEDSNPEPVPIHTENSIHAKIYLKAARLELFSNGMALLSFFLLLFPFEHFTEVFLSTITFFNTMGAVICAPFFLWTFGFTLRWYVKTRDAAKHDLPLPRVNRRLAKIRNTALSVTLCLLLTSELTGMVLSATYGGNMPVMLFGFIFAPFLAIFTGLWIRRQIDTHKRTRKTNKIIFISALALMELVLIGYIVFMIVRLPRTPLPDRSQIGSRPVLTLADIGSSAPAEHVSVRVEGTPVVPDYYQYFEGNRDGLVDTKVYRSVSAAVTRWLYERRAEEFTRVIDDARRPYAPPYKNLTPEEAAYWGADEGYAMDYENNGDIELLLRKDKAILQINASGDAMERETVREAVNGLW